MRSQNAQELAVLSSNQIDLAKKGLATKTLDP